MDGDTAGYRIHCRNHIVPRILFPKNAIKGPLCSKDITER